MGFYKGNQVARKGEVRRSAGPVSLPGNRFEKPQESPKGFFYGFWGPKKKRSDELPTPPPERETGYRLEPRFSAARTPNPGATGTVFYRPAVRVVPVPKQPLGHDRPRKSSKRWIVRMAVLALLAAMTVVLRTRVTAALQDLAGFKLQTVKVTGNHFLSEEDVLEASGLKLGSDMFGLDIPAAARRVEVLGWVEKVYLERRLPQSVLIAVTERQPSALVDSGGLWGLNAEGRLLPPSTRLAAEDLPILSGVRVGAEDAGTTRAARHFRSALDFLSFMKKEDPALYASVSEVNLSERDQLKTTFLDGLQTRFPPGAGETEMRRMAAVMSDLGSKGVRAESMDFRFRDQVVVKTR